MQLIEVRKIWGEAPHSAFTDLLRFQGRWFCAFREGEDHVSVDGALRVISSDDGVAWVSEALIRLDLESLSSLRPKVMPAGPCIHLRDPKISIAPDGRLMLNSAVAYNDRHDLQSLAWFSEDGTTWGPAVPIGEHQYWLWRVAWHDGVAYAVGRISDKRVPRLYRSTDGANFAALVKDEDFFPRVPGPSEATLRFQADGTALCLLRLNLMPGCTDDHARIGIARPPYTGWEWKSLATNIGGPNMIELPDGRIVATGRIWTTEAQTVLCWIDPMAGTLTEALVLPSGGDTSYPGMVLHDGVLWVSYYSSHEGKTSIYLAKVAIEA